MKPPPLPGSHVYDGYTFPAPFRAANFDAMKTWKVRDDDIFCITYAKSGKSISIESRQLGLRLPPKLKEICQDFLQRQDFLIFK